MGIRSVGRFIAKPFEKTGQGIKHFFTGPEYDKIAGDVATGRVEAPPPQTPMMAQMPKPSMPNVGSRGMQQAPPNTFDPRRGPGDGQGIGWKSVLPKKADGSIDWVRAAELGLVIGSVVEGWRATHKGNALAEEAINIEKERQAAMRPLRDQAIAKLSAGVERPDLSNLTDQTNPYRRGMRSVGSY
jgi:hypothetical protein